METAVSVTRLKMNNIMITACIYCYSSFNAVYRLYNFGARKCVCFCGLSTVHPSPVELQKKYTNMMRETEDKKTKMIQTQIRKRKKGS